MFFLRAALLKVTLILLVLLPLADYGNECRATEGSPTITDIVVTSTRDYLLVYFTVKDCFSPEITKAILSGIETTFTFFVKLYEPRELWWDVKLSDVKVKHSIKYDTLRKIFHLKLPERNDASLEVKDFEEAKSLMSEVVGLKVVRLDKLKKGARYRIQMMAELDKIRLPFHLHNILFFLSLWDFETPWYAVDFRY